MDQPDHSDFKSCRICKRDFKGDAKTQALQTIEKELESFSENEQESVSTTCALGRCLICISVLLHGSEKSNADPKDLHAVYTGQGIVKERQASIGRTELADSGLTCRCHAHTPLRAESQRSKYCAAHDATAHTNGICYLNDD